MAALSTKRLREQTARLPWFSACILWSFLAAVDLQAQTIGVLSPGSPLSNEERNEEYYSYAEISPDGRFVAGVTSGAYSHSRLSVWTIDDRKEVFSREFRDNPVVTWSVRSRDPKNLLAVMFVIPYSDNNPEKQVVEVLDFPSAKVTHSFELPERTYDRFLSLSDDGRHVAMGNDSEKSTVRVFDSTTGRLKSSIPLHFRALRSMTFVPGKPLLAMGGLLFGYSNEPTETIIVHDFEMDKPYAVSRWQKNAVASLAVSTDGLRLASQDSDRTIKLLSLEEKSLRVLGTISNESYSSRQHLRFSNNDSRLWHADERGFSLWDADSKELIHHQTLDCSYGDLDVAPASDVLVFANSSFQRIPMLLETSPILRFAAPIQSDSIFDSNPEELRRITLSRDGRLAVLERGYEGLSVIDLQLRRQVCFVPFDTSQRDIELKSVVVSSDLVMYFQREFENVLYRQQLPGGEPATVLRLPEGKRIGSAVCSPSGKYFAFGVSEYQTLIMDADGKLVGRADFQGDVHAVSSDGNWLALKVSGGIQIIDVAAGTELGVWNVNHAVDWSQDGSTLFGRGADRIGLWKLQRDSGEIRQDFALHRDGREPVRYMAVASAAPYLVAADQQHIRVYNYLSNRMLGVLRGHTGAIMSVAISTDGRTAYSGDDKGNLLKWDLTDWVTADRNAEREVAESVAFSTRTARPWSAEPRTFQGNSGVKITIDAGSEATAAVVEESLRQVLREIQSSEK
ncbi:MAG: WD40 repeat domain-containing protein [Planctomycetaceae bacterium]|nr:WD40 repeat domain-containing protein [Planctomycetaceae bacterium]